MEKTDKQRFAQIMLGMADNFRDSITQEGMAMRFDMLKDYDINKVESVAKQIMLVRKYTKMPPIAEFIEILQGGSREDRALIIANEIMAQSRRYSPGNPLKLDDPIAQHLMTARWPYHNWATTVLESELKWWVKEFCEAYNAYSATGVPPKQLEVSERLKKLIKPQNET